MTWTRGEIIWLLAILIGGLITVIGGIMDSRRREWANLHQNGRIVHRASLIVFASIWVGYVGILAAMMFKEVR